MDPSGPAFVFLPKLQDKFVWAKFQSGQVVDDTDYREDARVRGEPLALQGRGSSSPRRSGDRGWGTFIGLAAIK